MPAAGLLPEPEEEVVLPEDGEEVVLSVFFELSEGEEEVAPLSDWAAFL